MFSVYKNEQEVISELQKLIEEKANEAIKKRGRFFIGFSGGSLGKYLCKCLPKIKTDWSKWIVFFCDERYVAENDSDSTFGFYKQNLLPKVPLTEQQFVTINVKDPIEKVAADYEKRIREEFKMPDGVPSFDLLLLGIGPDGHTASLFPDHELLTVTDRLIAYINDSPKPPPQRITMTYTLINNARNSIFAVPGNGKAAIIKSIFGDKVDLPAGRANIGTSLKKFANDLGFFTIGDMIRTWDDFIFNGSGIYSEVQALELNHISEMAKYSKNSGSKSKNYRGFKINNTQWNNHNTRRHSNHSDIFAFSDNFQDYYIEFDDSGEDKDDSDDFIVASEQISHVKSIDVQIPSCTASDSWEYPKMMTICLMEIVNPHRFWFTFYDDFKKINELMKEMKNYYEARDHLKVDQKDLQSGLHVAVLYCSLWHRGRILKLKSPDIARIFYTDFGTVEDVPLNRICYLMNDFLQLPCSLKRGVLSFVQPTNGIWSENAKVSFHRCHTKKIEVCIFRKNPKDSSFYMSMKRPGRDSLIADILIKKHFCIYDFDFLSKDVVGGLTFDYYESGNFLDVVELMNQNSLKSWMPSSSQSKKLIDNHV
ncbi:CLUMA_CG001363, isoform A [Clunio marinus]|uniref:6-phosphogluconolactonase n=1 Tax=Clunio marinus TaxID=568069 RepID=A0A1J1HM86_9DIPT|nr:CLUMA_CG001363, isoform A [Clunio marinus]